MVDSDTLLEKHGRMVFGISWRILGNAADVEDNVQDVLLEAYRLSQSQKIRHTGGLLRRLATLGALARLRKRKKTVSLEGLSASEILPAAGGGVPEEHAIGRELEERLRRAVAGLLGREAAVFSLRYFENLALDQIARSWGIKYSAAGAALSRARAKLERLLEDVDVPVEKS